MEKKFLRNAAALTKFISKILTFIGHVIILISKNTAKLLKKIQKELIALKNHEITHRMMGLLLREFKKERDFSWVDKSINKIMAITPPRLPKKKREESAWVPKYKPVTVPKKSKTLLVAIFTFVLGIVFTTFFILIPSHIVAWFSDLPNPDLLITRSVPMPTRILDKNGRLLYEIYIDKRYEPVKLDQVPDHVVSATIAVEDDEFYTHFGFDPKSMIRAAKSTFIDDNLQGGSTITQQLVKNVLLTPERTVSRKVKELVLSVIAEIKYNKPQILELYLNNISYGGSAWGIQSASLKFFGKNVWEIDLAEAALLAGLPTAPSAYSPLTGDLKTAKARQKYVLDRMYSLGYITNKEAIEAYQKELVFTEQVEYIRAPHFVAYVRKDLEERFGRRFVELGGLTVTTTLDLELHEKVQEIVSQEVEKNKNLKISNGAAVVLDSQKSAILAYVGSVDYFKDDWGAFDVITSYRQPGSSIKPVTYALALEKGYTAASIIKDKPITYKIKGQPDYKPRNYDGKYHGEITVRQALANSYNVPAVRLANQLGPDNIVALGKEFGLSNWEVDGSYGLSITLGGKEVRLLDHTNLYATLARKGKYVEPTPYKSILDSGGFEVYKNSKEEKRAISQEVAYIIYTILSDEKARIPAFGTKNSLVIPNKTVAVKTGTTDKIRDNFTLGYTPSFTVGVWVGNNDNSPLHSGLASGLSGAAPMWNRIMRLVLEDRNDEKMTAPPSVFTKYDKECNQYEVFIKGTKVPEHLCKIEKDDSDKDKKKKDKKN